jgi:hypothetical protein
VLRKDDIARLGEDVARTIDGKVRFLDGAIVASPMEITVIRASAPLP